MKKVLFATSALVAFAGAAAAEVAVTGDARIGMRYDSNFCSLDGTGDITCDDGGWNVVNRARVRFTMTGQTDSGLEFGATFRADQASAARVSGNGGLSADTGEVYVSGTYGKLTAGDIDSAMEKALGDLPEIGVSGLDYYNEFSYQTSDYDDSLYNEAGLLYEYSINGVKLYASFMDQSIGESNFDRDNNAYSLGAGYEMAGYQFGIGYEKSDIFQDPLTLQFDPTERDVKSWGVSAATTFREVKVKGIYTSTDVEGFDDKIDQFGIGAEYKLANGIGLEGFYRRVAVSTFDADILGLGTTYDLGGGASLDAGIVHISADGPEVDADKTLADFGLNFKF